MDSNMDKIRFFTELIQLTGAFLYIVAALREMKFLGYHMFIENLVSELKFSMIALRCRDSNSWADENRCTNFHSKIISITIFTKFYRFSILFKFPKFTLPYIFRAWQLRTVLSSIMIIISPSHSLQFRQFNRLFWPIHLSIHILDDSPISCDVFIFVLPNDDHHPITNILLNRIRRSCMRSDYADNRSVFFILLQVRLILIMFLLH